MIPARRFFVALGVVTLLLGAGPLLPGSLALVAALDLVLLLLLVVDWLRARRVELRAARTWPEVVTQRHPDEEARTARQDLELRVKGDETRSIEVSLREVLHPALVREPFDARLHLEPGRPARLRVALYPLERSEHLVGPLMARVLGPWGLAWAQRRLLPEEPVRVFPRVRWGGRVGQLLALAQRRELGSVSLDQRGLGGELYALRRYQTGDARNRIHWRATARRGYLVTREDSWERGAPLVVLLDCGRALSTRTDGLAKLDHSLAACLALTRLAAGRGDRVTIVAFSDEVHRTVSVRRGKAGVAAAYDQLYDLEPRNALTLYGIAAERVLRMHLPRSTVLMLTSVVDLAVADPLTRAVAQLQRRHRTVLVNLEDAVVRQLAEDPPETTAEAFAKVSSLEILLRNRRLAAELRRRGTLAVAAPADRLALETLESYLEVLQSTPLARRAR